MGDKRDPKRPQTIQSRPTPAHEEIHEERNSPESVEIHHPEDHFLNLLESQTAAKRAYHEFAALDSGGQLVRHYGFRQELICPCIKA